MYHIFLIIAAAASQNQIDNLSHQLNQRKIAHIRNIEIAKNGGKDDLIISQLKKQVETEEKAIKPDLESLGLDPVDNTSSSIFVKDQQAKEIEKPQSIQISEAQKDTKVLLNIEIDNKKNLTKVNDKTNEEAKKEETKKEEVKAFDKVNKDLKENNLPDPKDIGGIIEKDLNKSNFNNDQDSKVIDNNPDDKSKKKKGFLDKIVAKLKTQDQPKEEDDKKTETKAVEILENANTKKNNSKEEIKPSNKDDDKKIQLEKLEKEKEKREQRVAKKIALAELKQKQKIQKLEAIRQQYLKQDEVLDNNIYEGITHYQIMSKIIPQKKVMPKFFNDEVPPPLLNRFKSPDNSHHPIIISNSEKIDFMFKTIAENRIDDFNSIFSSINNPNIKNSFGDTLLTFAVLMKRHDAISSLLSKGANPNLANDLGYTPLNIAIEMVDYKSTSILIEIGGAKVDFIDDLGRTYLMQAARVGSLPIVDLLISKGVDINAADNNGTTALAIAYKHKKDIIAKYLLKFGAKSWIKKNYIEDDTPMIQDLFNKWK